MGWFGKLLMVGIAGYVGFSAYDLHRAGYFSLPDIPAGAYPISFRSGLRGVVYDMDVTDDQYADAPKIFRRLRWANPDRRFIAVLSEVPYWFQDVWATCRVGTEEERAYIIGTLPDDVKRKLVGTRLDAICYIELEGQRAIVRGLIYSIPA